MRPERSGRQVRHARLDAVGVVLGIGELRRAGPRDYESYGLRPAPLRELDADLVGHPGAQAVAEDHKWLLAQRLGEGVDERADELAHRLALRFEHTRITTG